MPQSENGAGKFVLLRGWPTKINPSSSSSSSSSTLVVDSRPSQQAYSVGMEAKRKKSTNVDCCDNIVAHQKHDSVFQRTMETKIFTVRDWSGWLDERSPMGHSRASNLHCIHPNFSALIRFVFSWFLIHFLARRCLSSYLALQLYKYVTIGKLVTIS